MRRCVRSIHGRSRSGRSVLWPVLLVAGAVLASVAQARVSSEEAARLGGDLTPLGAIRAGNPEGTVPSWEGGITAPPTGYRRGMHHPDPFAEDEPLFTISAANADQHASQLSPGQIAMLRRYPETWRMPIYRSRRSAAYPERIYVRTIANVTTAELTDDGNGVAHAAEGFPFPIPRNGLEAIWTWIPRMS